MLGECCEIVVPSCSNERIGCMQKWVSGLLVGGSGLEGMLNSLLQADPHSDCGCQSGSSHILPPGLSGKLRY